MQILVSIGPPGSPGINGVSYGVQGGHGGVSYAPVYAAATAPVYRAPLVSSGYATYG